MKNLINSKQLRLLIVTILFYSCGGIEKYKNTNFKPLRSVDEIEGIYNNTVQDSTKLYHRTFNGNLNWRKKYRDTTSFENFKIRILNEKLLKIDFYKSDSLSKSRLLRYRLRNNGFIKLRNQNFRIVGIPYIFGEYNLVKFELGLTTENDLILNGYQEHAGGLLIFLSSGRAYDVNHIYNKY